MTFPIMSCSAFSHICMKCLKIHLYSGGGGISLSLSKFLSFLQTSKNFFSPSFLFFPPNLFIKSSLTSTLRTHTVSVVSFPFLKTFFCLE
jgi:hypothetical protein